MMGRTSITYITRYVSKNGYLISAFLPLFLATKYLINFLSRIHNTICSSVHVSVLFAESLRHMTSARRPFYSQRYEFHRRVSRYHEFAALILIVSEATTRSTGGTCRR